VPAQLGVNLDVDRQLADSLADALDLTSVDPLSGWRLGSVVFYTDNERATCAIRETDAVTGELWKVAMFAVDNSQRLAIEVLSLYLLVLDTHGLLLRCFARRAFLLTNCWSKISATVIARRTALGGGRSISLRCMEPCLPRSAPEFKEGIPHKQLFAT